jgi:hypothetical protein
MYALARAAQLSRNARPQLMKSVYVENRARLRGQFEGREASIVLPRGKGARQRCAVVRGADWQSARIARDAPEHAGPAMRIEPSPTIRPRVFAQPVA